MLDAAVAKSLKSFADALEGTPEDKFQDAALEYCKKVLTDHQRILFSGDGYSDEWPIEAEKRGLANNMPVNFRSAYNLVPFKLC